MDTHRQGYYRISFSVLHFFLFTVAILLFSSNCVNAGQWPIPDSGQTTCYDDQGNVIDPCPSPGEPFYGQDANYSINPRSYTKLDDYGNDLPVTATFWTMIRDNITGLIWEVKNKDRSLNYVFDKYTWDETKGYIELLNSEHYGGFTNWRMPTIQELASIVYYEQYYPANDRSIFPYTRSDRLLRTFI